MWVVGDQAVSSATNFGLTLLVAHLSSARDFGSFALSMTVALTVLAVVRGLAGDPLAAGYASTGTEALAAAARQALSALLVLVAAVSVAMALIAVALPASVTSDGLLALAVVVPGVMVQDFVRSVYVIGGAPRSAFLNDLGWAVLMVVGYAALLGAGAASAAEFLLVWGACGTLCGVVGLFRLRLLPAWRSVSTWLRSTRHLWPYFLSDNAVLQGGILATSAVIALSAGLGDVAGLRAVTLLFGPIIVLAQAGMLFAVPELARHADSGGRVRRDSARIGAALAGVTAVVGVVAWLIPQDLGTAVFGETWRYTHPLIAFATIDAIGSMLILGCAIGLRATSSGRRSLGARLITATGRLVVCTVGALLGGAYGAVGMAAAFAPVSVSIWWRQLVVVTR